MTEAQQPDALKKLLVFIIALAILATIIAIAWNFAVDLPQQPKTLQAPANSLPIKECKGCASIVDIALKTKCEEENACSSDTKPKTEYSGNGKPLED